MSDRPHCRDAASCRAKTPGKHCSPCSLSALQKDPAFRAKRADAYRNKLAADEEFRARHARASADRLREWRERGGFSPERIDMACRNLAIANDPERTAARTRAAQERAYAGIPEERWDEVRRLSRTMPAADAKHIVMEDERAKARRAVHQVKSDMLARRAREKAQAY